MVGSKDMVYATVIEDNVETLLGFDVVQAYLDNKRAAMRRSDCWHAAASQMVFYLHSNSLNKFSHHDVTTLELQSIM